MNVLTRLLKTSWYVLTLQCDEADRLRSVSDPSELRGYELWAERLHRLGCRSCRQAKRQVDLLRELTDDLQAAQPPLTAGPELSPEARARIAAELNQAAEEKNRE